MLKVKTQISQTSLSTQAGKQDLVPLKTSTNVMKNNSTLLIGEIKIHVMKHKML